MGQAVTHRTVHKVLVLRNIQSMDFSIQSSARLQAMRSDQGLSKFSQTLSGVLQGSILGPTIFVLFVNDLPFCIKYCSSVFYSDDNALHVSSKSKNEIEPKIQFDSDETNAWSKRNKMGLRYKKKQHA